MDSEQSVDVAGRYRLVRKLGSGGMGSVWLAQDLVLEAPCALKLIDHDKLENAEVRLRFAREAKLSAQVRGPHVVDVYDHGEWQGVPFIAMEYLEGEDLGSRLEREKKLDPLSTYLIVAQVARALTRAHAAGIVHRDLKPENVFLVAGDEYEIAKVLDFGIAKHGACSLEGRATKTGSFLGTPYYVSPEQARGKVVDYRSDLWSLGVITFLCLTGRAPFESEALGELMGLILYEQLPWPSEYNPDLPPAIDGFWLRAAARDPDQRFQSAKELADALADALGVERKLAVPSIVPRSLEKPSGTSSIPPAPALPFELRRPRKVEAEPSDCPSDAPVALPRSSERPAVAAPRRRHLFAFGVLGVAFGAAGTLSLVSSPLPPAPAALLSASVMPEAEPSVAPPPVTAPAASATGTRAAPAPSAAPPLPSATPSAPPSASPKLAAPRPKRVPKRRAAPRIEAPRPKTSPQDLSRGEPDYGI